jgi:hypothetical protein
MSSAQLYDTIGVAYTVTRRAEPRIAARVWGCARRCADESIPFEDQSFDAAMAFATVHQSAGPDRGPARSGAWLAAWWSSRTTADHRALDPSNA